MRGGNTRPLQYLVGIRQVILALTIQRKEVLCVYGETIVQAGVADALPAEVHCLRRLLDAVPAQPLLS